MTQTRETRCKFISACSILENIYFSMNHTNVRGKMLIARAIFSNKLLPSAQTVSSKDFVWKSRFVTKAHIWRILLIQRSLYLLIWSLAQKPRRRAPSKRTQFLIFICISARISFNKFTSEIQSILGLYSFYSSSAFYNQKIVTVTN